MDTCDNCGRKAELFHNETAGLAFCETCDAAADLGASIDKAAGVKGGTITIDLYPWTDEDEIQDILNDLTRIGLSAESITVSHPNFQPTDA